MKNFRIIEEGVLSHTEMNNIRGGTDTSKCKIYSCNYHASSQQCVIKYSICGTDYVSCTGPKNSEKMSCKSRYIGSPGPGGLTVDSTSILTL